MSFFSVVSAETAIGILNGRCREGAECSVSVCGKVTCVSEVVRIKDNHIFMVKFIPNVDVIIKRKEFLHWQLELTPYKEFILTDLRPTTLQKGSSTRQRVFTVTSSSKLLLPDDVDMRFMTESEMLKQYGLQGVVEQISSVHRQDPVIDSLFSYQGKVTAVLDQGLGVFELDSTVRLFVGPVPAVHKFSMLKVGMTVLVQNAHYTTSKQYPRVSVYCCMLTKVQCIDEIVQQVSPVKLSQVLQKLLYLTGQSQNQLDFMFALRQVLRRQFLDILVERCTERIFSVVIGHANFTAGNRKTSQRMLIDEFLNVPHSCPLLRADKVKIKFSTIVDIKESISDVSSDSMEWKFSRQLANDQQVFLGILNVCEKTGQTVLCDNTGSIDTVICCYHGDRDKMAVCCHTCTEACNCDKIEIGENFPCPYAQTCCIGKIVAISVYEMISETMVTRNVENLKGLNESERSRPSSCDKYLLIDMRSAVYIGNSVKVDNSRSRHKNTGSAKSLSSDGVETLNNSNTAKTTSNCESLKTEMVKCNISSNIQVGTEQESNNCTTDSVECISKKTSALHKHVKPDGSIVFCRKAECCDKQNVLGSRYEMNLKVNNNGKKVTSTSELDTCKENCSVNSKHESSDSNLLPYKLSNTAFKVKPVSTRKRQFGESSSDIQIDSGLHKIPRNDSSCQPVLDKVETTDDGAGELDVIIYIENKGSLMPGDGLRRFNVECTVLKRQGNEK
ncbi:uncharacterized protein LOC128552453, partial [Mercenaria mercenaria]|uniref:uncharacterized protein LOC128552453 n=1 Tax=Mercenaria mercenaria TaxID=6596 RepID=UPI00234F4D97